MTRGEERHQLEDEDHHPSTRKRHRRHRTAAGWVAAGCSVPLQDEALAWMKPRCSEPCHLVAAGAASIGGMKMFGEVWVRIGVN